MQVYSIRDAAANNLKRLAEEFGLEWAMQHIVPQVRIVLLNLSDNNWIAVSLRSNASLKKSPAQK